MAYLGAAAAYLGAAVAYLGAAVAYLANNENKAELSPAGVETWAKLGNTCFFYCSLS